MNIYIILCIVLSFILAFVLGCLYMWNSIYKELNSSKNNRKYSYTYYTECYPRITSSHIDRYPLPKGEIVITKNIRQKEIGIISNLMANMIKKNASEYALKNLTNYSMVVMDAIKYKLDYKKAYKDYGIEELKKEYLK